MRILSSLVRMRLSIAERCDSHLDPLLSRHQIQREAPPLETYQARHLKEAQISAEVFFLSTDHGPFRGFIVGIFLFVSRALSCGAWGDASSVYASPFLLKPTKFHSRRRPQRGPFSRRDLYSPYHEMRVCSRPRVSTQLPRTVHFLKAHREFRKAVTANLACIS